MKNYAGLDVSLKEVSICVVDDNGKTVAHGVAPARDRPVKVLWRNVDDPCYAASAA